MPSFLSKMPLLFMPIFSSASPLISSLPEISVGFLLLRRATARLLNANLPPFSPISNFPSLKNPTALLAAILASPHRCWHLSTIFLILFQTLHISIIPYHFLESQSPHTPSSPLLKLGMSKSCLPSSPYLMPLLASSSQPTTSPLSFSSPGFGRNVREESTENIEDSKDDEGDEVNAKETNEITENSSDEEVDEEDHDISKMVLTLEFQELPPLIVSEYCSAKVTVRSKMTILEDIHIWLIEEDKTVFQSYLQLGPFIDLPIGGEFSGALAHNLLLRKTVCQKDHEVWFLIEKKPLRFNEFVLISGLYTDSGPSEDEIKLKKIRTS